MAASKRPENLSKTINILGKIGQLVLEEGGFLDQEISEIHVTSKKKRGGSGARDDKEPIVCKNVKVGNRWELVCKRASQW